MLQDKEEEETLHLINTDPEDKDKEDLLKKKEKTVNVKNVQGSAWPPQGQKVSRSPPRVPSKGTSAESLKSLGAIGKDKQVPPIGSDLGSGQVHPGGEQGKKPSSRAVGDDLEEMEARARMTDLRKTRGYLLRSFNKTILAC